MSGIYVDANNNQITVEETNWRDDGNKVVIARLVNAPKRGYIAVDQGIGGFGNAECPSSYGMPCVTWFGGNERFPTAEAAITAIYEND